MSNAQDAGTARTPSKDSKTSRFKRIAGLSRKSSHQQNSQQQSSQHQQQSSDRPDSRQTDNFSATNILPTDGYRPNPSRAPEDVASQRQQQSSQPVFGTPAGEPSSGQRSESPPSVFDSANGRRDQEVSPATTRESDDQEQGSYDLKPPPPKVSPNNVESLAARFYSLDHLDHIVRDLNHGPRFRRFLDQYKPRHVETLNTYLESRKAITAIEYANSVASQIPATDGGPPFIAATLDDEFEAKSASTAEELVEDALPSYTTNRMVAIITDTLVKEIMGTNAPFMKEMIPSLAEVYCISDPSTPDNPIVYASEEFFNMTQYGRDYVIGRNCRFLQGPRTSHASIQRLVDAIAAGEECCETVLNYKRDGTPFMNLLMIAPMYDNKGDVRYFLGAQIDVSPLIVEGKGLESFSQLLKQDKENERFGGSGGQQAKRDPMEVLGELGQMLNEAEAGSVKNKMEGGSAVGSPPTSGRSTPQQNSRQGQGQRRPGGRRYLSMDDNAGSSKGGSMKQLWPDPSFGKSGRLPGVYRNYLLVRPHPSLRITFTSPALRIPGLLQTKFMDRIGGSQQVRDGLLDAFSSGSPITAKVSWIPHQSEQSGRRYGGDQEGKPRWVHCTPLIGSDERVGVWMIVMVENEEISGQLRNQYKDVDRSAVAAGPIQLGEIAEQERENGNMYAEYMRNSRDGGQRPGTGQTSSTVREQREVDGQFRDF